MLPQTEQDVAIVRRRLTGAWVDFSEAKSRLRANDDTELREQIKRAKFALSDVEDLYLRPLGTERNPRRSSDEELFILSGAINQLVNVAIPRVSRIVELSRKYGVRSEPR